MRRKYLQAFSLHGLCQNHRQFEQGVGLSLEHLLVQISAVVHCFESQVTRLLDALVLERDLRLSHSLLDPQSVFLLMRTHRTVSRAPEKALPD